MGKPEISVYEKFRKRFFEITKEVGKEQYLVPYLMSSHPGSRLSDAVELAEYLKKTGCSPEQVQDYYPTPGTASTVMFYTGYDPLTMKEVFCESDYHGKTLQRALLQFNRPENSELVREALRKCGREDLIGNMQGCLVRPKQFQNGNNFKKPSEQKNSRSGGQKDTRTGRSSGKTTQSHRQDKKAVTRDKSAYKPKKK